MGSLSKTILWRSKGSGALIRGKICGGKHGFVCYKSPGLAN